MLVPRDLTGELKDYLKQFPVVCVLGPRQAGKTTLAKMTLPRADYWDLELPSVRERLELAPEEFLRSASAPTILDEAQYLPLLFPILRAVIDEKRKRKGRFLLLGSASPHLVKGISESLAGRVGFLEIDTLSWHEIQKSRSRFSFDRRWQRGGFPDALQASSFRNWHRWMEGYTRTFIERDLIGFGVDVDFVRLRRLCGMLSHLHGGLWNASEIAGSLGVSYHTANRYLEILEQSFLVRRLQPWFANIGKRLVKRPKVFWRDSGLLHYWLGLSGSDDILSHPKAGASWEGFIIEEVLRREYLVNPASKAYFFRTNTGLECDLLLLRGQKLIPLEIKLGATVKKDEANKLKRIMELLNCQEGHFICSGRKTYAVDGIKIWNVRELLASDPWALS